MGRVMLARGAAIVVAVACSDSKPPPPELAACDKGEAAACFVAAARYRTSEKAELAKAVALWERGCERGHGASCAQLGTVAEHGMLAAPDPAEARRYFARACAHGATDVCARAGVAAPGVPRDAQPSRLEWREALTPICGKPRATLGPLFDGLSLGQPMTPAMKERVRAYEAQFGAKVHYDEGDASIQSLPLLEVRFDAADGLDPILAAGWGKPDLAYGAWKNAEAHVIATLLRGGTTTGIAWTRYSAVDELVRPADKAALGFEPIPVVGARLADVETALGPRLLRASEDTYRWTEVGSGPGFEVVITVRGGTVVKLQTVNWITNASEVGDQLLAALATKWGTPTTRDGVATWRLPGRRVTARKPAPGNFEIVIEQR